MLVWSLISQAFSLSELSLAFLFLKSKGSFRCIFHWGFQLPILFLLFSKAWHLCQFLEWKFIEFSGLFHCLIIKVLFCRFLLFSRSDFFMLPQLFLNVKHFFHLFSETFVKPESLNCLNCFNFSLIWISFVIIPHVLSFVNTFFCFFSPLFTNRSPTLSFYYNPLILYRHMIL